MRRISYKSDEKIFTENIYTIYDYPEEIFNNGYGTFDIETNSIMDPIKPYGYMYIWQFCGNGIVVMGRTWEDFRKFIEGIKKDFIIFVHGLFFEFQFFRNIIPIDKTFFTEERNPLKVKSGHIEFRCSFRLTNMSLIKCTSFYDVEHKKLSGEDFDYSKERYPWTELTDQELGYCFCDVKGLDEVIRAILKDSGYSLKKLPLTSTGFIRNEARRAVLQNKKNQRIMKKSALSPHTYGLCKAASRGGNSHANPYYSGQILERVRSFDMSSAYPAIEIQKKFPVTKFLQTSYTDLDELIDKGKAFIAVVYYEDLSIKTLRTIPYLSKAKALGIEGHKSDNGRILSAKKIAYCITDIDYGIIKKQYNYNIKVQECYTANYGYLPDEYRNFVLYMYRKKCDLKGKDEYIYGKYKNKINATFGMMLTDIVHEEIEYTGQLKPFNRSYPNPREALEKYYSNRKSFLSYQHGIYVTAHCRKRLQDAIDLLGEDMVYCDTDSVKFLDREDSENIKEKLNKKILKDIKACGIDTHYVREDGKAFNLGLWEDDGFYEEFITQGSKKYCYIENGDLHITVAGLSKTKGADYLIKNGGISSFNTGFVFPPGASGRTSAHYDDRTEAYYIYREGKKILTGSSIAIENVNYTLGVTKEYGELRNEIQKPIE